MVRTNWSFYGHYPSSINIVTFSSLYYCLSRSQTDKAKGNRTANLRRTALSHSQNQEKLVYLSLEFQKSLMSKYPKLYEDCHTFKCPVGYKDIIERLSYDLSLFHVEHIGPKILAIKPLHGCLRICIREANDEIHDLIESYEHLSTLVCELCASKAAISYEAYTSPRCKSCKKRGL